MVRKNPDTSIEAFKSLDPEKLSDIHRKILWGLSKMGESTFEELAAFLHIQKDKIWRRLSELHKQELIYRPGNKRVLKSGRMGYTWKMTHPAMPKTQAAEKMLKGDSIADYSRRISGIAKSVPDKQTKLL